MKMRFPTTPKELLSALGNPPEVSPDDVRCIHIASEPCTCDETVGAVDRHCPIHGAPSPTQAVAAAARAVEEACQRFDRSGIVPGDSAQAAFDNMLRCLGEWRSARLAAREAGYVEVMVIKEAIEALRNWLIERSQVRLAYASGDQVTGDAKREGLRWSAMGTLMMLVDNLADVLKEPK